MSRFTVEVHDGGAGVESLAGAEPLTIALPKGRLLPPSVRVLSSVGVDCSSVSESSRKLVFASGDGRTKFVVVRPGDVPTYVEYGAADLGVAGKDVLLEGQRDVCELLDLEFGACRMVLAARKGEERIRINGYPSVVRVATKFPVIAASYFRSEGIHAEIVKVSGAAEIAPAAGLSNVIVDIVATGKTLRENDMVVLDNILTSTARLIANRASFRLKHDRIEALVSGLRESLLNRGETGEGLAR